MYQIISHNCVFHRKKQPVVGRLTLSALHARVVVNKPSDAATCCLVTVCEGLAGTAEYRLTAARSDVRENQVG